MRVYRDQNSKPPFEAAMELQNYIGQAFPDLVQFHDMYPGLSSIQNSSYFGSNYNASPFSNGRNTNIQITFKAFCSKNYPKGDNRIFRLNYPHTYADFASVVDEKYHYMKPLLLLYRDARGEMVTIDGDFSYKNCLEDAWKQRKLDQFQIYVKTLGTPDDNWDHHGRRRGSFSRRKDNFSRVPSNVGFGFGAKRQKSWFFV